MAKDKRIDWIDLLKGIAILWLVVYHFHAVGWLRSPVPVFFFLSGLFFSEGKSYSSFLAKKAKALLVPLLFFFALGVAAAFVKSVLQGEAYSFPSLWLFATMIPADAPVTNPLGVGAIWFLLSLFEVYAIYYLLRKVSTNRWWLWMVSVLLFLLSAVVMQRYAIGSMFYLFYTCGFVIYFVAANMLKEKVLYSKMPSWALALAALAYSVRLIDVERVVNTGQMWGGVFY